MNQTRSKPRFFGWISGSFKVEDTGFLSDKSVIFGKQRTLSEKPFGTEVDLKHVIKGKGEGAYVVHPNFCQGWNPQENLEVGLINFTRRCFVSTNNPAVITERDNMPPEYFAVVQALGRLQRHQDKSAIMLIRDSSFYSHLRFTAPRMPEQRIKELDQPISEGYYSRSSSTPAMHTKNNNIYLLQQFTKIEDGAVEVETNGKVTKMKVVNATPEVKAIYGVTIVGKVVIAHNLSTVDKLNYKQLPISYTPKRMIDNTTGEDIDD